MPGGPGYPGAVPQFAGDGTVVFCVRDRGCTHLYAVVERRRAAAARRRPGTRRGGPLRRGRDRASCSRRRPRSGRSSSSTSRGSGDGAHRHGVSAGGDRALRPRGARVHDLGRHGRPGLAHARPERATPPPLLLDIHGGPHNAWNGAADSIHLYHQELVARGWTVLLLNPRGSDGYGEDFYRAALGDWGEADAQDFLEPIDALVAEGIADPERLAITGYSYGGYMTCYLTSRDERFAAAVAGGVVSDLVSMAGTSDMGHYLGQLELGRTVGERATATSRCRRSPASTASSRRRSSTTARPTSGVRSARRSSGTRRCASEAYRRRSSSTRTRGTCSSSTGGRRIAPT